MVINGLFIVVIVSTVVVVTFAIGNQPTATKSTPIPAIQTILSKL